MAAPPRRYLAVGGVGSGATAVTTLSVQHSWELFEVVFQTPEATARKHRFLRRISSQGRGWGYAKQEQQAQQPGKGVGPK